MAKKSSNLVIHLPSIRQILKRGAKSLMLAYALLLMLTLWGAEETYERQLAFQRDCEAVGGFITFADGQQRCTHLRKMNGIFHIY